MRLLIAISLAGTSMVALAQGAFAQTAPTSTQGGPNGATAQPDAAGLTTDQDTVGGGDIVVTARRRSEKLQNVPQTVNAVSGETVEKLNILKFEDVSSVVPGLALSSGEGGVNPSASLRGVTFRVDSAAPPTVALYLNEAPVDASILFQAVFDIGQIEVLRGPQGTLRGISAPSGSITVSTRRPDTSSVGGYVNMSGSTRGAINAQGAINVPLIKDVLAVRVAGVVDQNDVDGVRSINGGGKPFDNTLAGRVTALFTPTDNLSAVVMYQHVDQKLSTFRQVAGPGSLGGGTANAAPGYNGPAIAPSDRLAVAAGPSTAHQYYDLVTGQVDWEVGGQKLSYVGEYLHSIANLVTAQDFVNQVVRYAGNQPLDQLGIRTTQELRLSSVKPVFGLIDYTVGAYHSYSVGKLELGFPASFLPGAFGPPSAQSPSSFDSRYVLPLTVTGPTRLSEMSAFANATVHISPRTELSVGGRYVISSKKASDILGVVGSGIIAVNVPVPASFCTAIGAIGSTYTGSCDFPVPTVGTVFSSNVRQNEHPVLYTASLSHRFSDDFLVYANTGSSFRLGPTNTIGINNASNDPTLQRLVYLPSETSRSYEIGFKSTLFQRRLRLNVAAFHQDFKNYIFRTLPTPYLSDSGTSVTVQTTTFTAPVDAVVNGIDVDATLQLGRNFSIGASFSYANSHIANALAPCRDSNFDGVPDTGTATVAQFQAAGQSIAMCKSKASISQSAPWNLTLQSEYSTALSSNVDGFVRGLLNYYPTNTRASLNFVTRSYGILNLYAGIRSPKGEWEVSVFAKNALNTQRLLSRDFGYFDYNNLSDTFGQSGYNGVTYTPQREFGLNVRYMFGSR